jgi:hypothetical protein
MAPPHTLQLVGRADWALMIAVHDALRRDLDQLLHPAGSPASARARWATFRSQLRFHLAAEQAAMWPRVRVKLAGDPHGQTLSPGELGGIAAAIRGGHSTRRAGTTLPWALAGAAPTSVSTYCASCPHPPASFTGRSGCRATPTPPRRYEQHPARTDSGSQ